MKTFVASSLVLAASASAYVTGINPWNPPHKSESGQSGYNDCGTHDSKNSQCQTLWVNNADDWCFFGPPTKNAIGNIERIAVSYCMKAGHGARLVPKGTFKNMHFVETPHYIQITATGDFTKVLVPKGDEGGELDPHGADGKGNPIGGLVFGYENGHSGSAVQRNEWTEFISDNEFCLRVCKNGPDAWRYCQHIYDVMGCRWNMPGNYGSGFDQCQGDDVPHPMGEYAKNGGTSTWYQGVKPTPPAGKAGKTSKCQKVASPTGASYPKSKRAIEPVPSAQPVVEKREVSDARRHVKKAAEALAAGHFN